MIKREQLHLMILIQCKELDDFMNLQGYVALCEIYTNKHIKKLIPIN